MDGLCAVSWMSRCLPHSLFRLSHCRSIMTALIIVCMYSILPSFCCRLCCFEDVVREQAVLSSSDQNIFYDATDIASRKESAEWRSNDDSEDSKDTGREWDSPSSELNDTTISYKQQQHEQTVPSITPLTPLIVISSSPLSEPCHFHTQHHPTQNDGSSPDSHVRLRVSALTAGP